MTREEYADEAGALDEDGNRMFKNTDSNGRFHSDWCSMMYSRLMVARTLLSDDGVMLVSIDYHESANLRKIIDEVAKYKQYDDAGQPINGIYADMFEKEYDDVVTHLQTKFGEDEYLHYLSEISAGETHAGYFSIDKKGKMTDSKLKNKKEKQRMM